MFTNVPRFEYIFRLDPARKFLLLQLFVLVQDLVTQMNICFPISLLSLNDVNDLMTSGASPRKFLWVGSGGL